MRRLVPIAFLGLMVMAIPARAQMGGSLGGYGASSPMPTGGRSSLVIPYGGMDQGLMPGRVSSAPLMLRPRPDAAMGAIRPSFVPAAMAPKAIGMGMSAAPGGPMVLPALPSSFSPLLSGRMASTSPSAAATGVMPPSFASSFRPPVATIPGAPGAAMMMAP